MEDKPLATDTDRISDLPRPIIHHILSFLLIDTYNLGQLARLSKAWYHITASYPIHDFEGLSSLSNTDKYVNFVTRRLQRFLDYNLQMESLTIPVIFRYRVARSLDKWIALALQRGVKELNLEFKFARGEYYSLPRDVFKAKSIKVAKFVRCNLLQSIPHHGSSGTNLVKLCLDGVLLNEQTFSSIISRCPLIEDLSVIRCDGVKCFRISNLQYLKTLQISDIPGSRSVQIDAPSLQSLDVSGPVTVSILESPNLRDLNIHCVDLENLELQDVLSRLSFLRSVCLSFLSGFNKLKVSSHTLKKLAISWCYDLAELEIDAPNLNSVEYDGPFTPLVSLKHNATSRWSVSTSLQGFRSSYTIEELLVGLRNFVSNVKHFECLWLTIDTSKIQSFSFEELNEKAIQVQPIIPNIDLLRLNISYPDLFEGVLWSCHPSTLCLELERYSVHYNNVDVVKSICKIIASHRHCCSCTLWPHHLEDVRYVTEDGSEDGMDNNSTPNLLKSYREIKFIFKW